MCAWSDMLTHGFNLSTIEAEAVNFCEFDASYHDVMRSCPKRKKKKRLGDYAELILLKTLTLLFQEFLKTWRNTINEVSFLICENLAQSVDKSYTDLQSITSFFSSLLKLLGLSPKLHHKARLGQIKWLKCFLPGLMARVQSPRNI